jgi:(p)ppGpp synthase/HD superfamily hydrolase
MQCKRNENIWKNPREILHLTFTLYISIIHIYQMEIMVDILRMEKALVLAAKAHRNQSRKHTDIPYIIHPVAVAFKLWQEKCPEDLIIAGLLHDVVEDSAVTILEIKDEFGDQVADIVQACTEPGKMIPWEKRKQVVLQRIREGSMALKLVACADKLHNIECMIDDYLTVGDKLWKRFSRGREQQEWFHRSLVDSFFHGLSYVSEDSLFFRFRGKVDLLFGELEWKPMK